MMQQAAYLVMIVALLLAGCHADTPTQVQNDNDEVVARIVAGAAGYESNGFAATVSDLIAAGSGSTVRQQAGDATRTAVVVTASDSVFDPRSKSQMLSLSCERNRADELSEWNLRYKIQFAGVHRSGGTPKPVDPVEAVLHTSGTYRNDALTVQGESSGHVAFESLAPQTVGLSGEYRWRGSTVMLGEGEERYNDVTVKFTLTKLQAISGAAGEVLYIGGRADVQVKANGPAGVISRNGSLQFEGDRAVLAMGGKRYILNIRLGEYQARG